MARRAWTRWLLAIAVPVASAVAIAGFLMPAHAVDDGAACTYTDRVDGCGSVLTDDFADNAELRWMWGSRSDGVLLWQAILLVDGYFAAGCRTVEGKYLCFKGYGELDGEFGERTHYATKAWQRAHGLSADGQVGPKTWAAASRFLKGGNAGGPDWFRVVYGRYGPDTGTASGVLLNRRTNGGVYGLVWVKTSGTLANRTFVRRSTGAACTTCPVFFTSLTYRLA